MRHDTKLYEPPLCCDCCGEEIMAGSRYYELPDGLLACAESDCLRDWAAVYGRIKEDTNE